jgi:hypothetical protein
MRYMKGDMCVYSHLFSFFFWCCCTSTRVSLKNFHVDITSCCWNYCFFLYYCLKKKDTTQTLAFSGRRVLRKKIKKSKTPNATKRKGAADRTWRKRHLWNFCVFYTCTESVLYIEFDLHNSNVDTLFAGYGDILYFSCILLYKSHN